VERTSENGIEYDASLKLAACFRADLAVKIKRMGRRAK
jgi:hypothetical protein